MRKNRIKPEKLFTMSSSGVSEYCCTAVKIGHVEPIPNSDFLGVVKINGDNVVVRKDQVKEGMVLFYASNETQLNPEFLAANNLYEIAEYERNDNRSEVAQLISEGKKDDAKKLVGFFNKCGRVRMVKLKGEVSMGFLFGVNELAKYNNKLVEVNPELLLGKDFDTIDGELFVRAYVPPIKERKNSGKKEHKKQTKEKKFKRVIDDQFTLHYDTNLLAKNMHKISPDNIVAISVKLHGTSAIFANVKTMIPIKLGNLTRLKNWFIDTTHLLRKYRTIDYKIDYGNVFSSRRIIQNKYEYQNPHHDSKNIYGEVNDFISPFIEKGMTVYGEIVGFMNGGKCIQKNYDYNCKQGEWKFMPYRINMKYEDGSTYEYNVMEVVEWTEKLIQKVGDNANKLIAIPVLFHGKLSDLYPQVEKDSKWNENILQLIQNDSEHFGMELNEPLCKNKVPREGLCVRIDNDPNLECFKVKTVAFREREAKSIDNGEVDMEMEQAY